MTEEFSPTLLIVAAGTIGGFMLGFAARLGRFCTLGAIEDTLFSGDTRRVRMWGIGLSVAIISFALSAAIGLVNVSESIYTLQACNLVSWVVGGTMFGVGMAFCGTCAFGTLVRLGGGDL